MSIRGISIQGDPNSPANYITRFKFRYSVDGLIFLDKTGDSGNSTEVSKAKKLLTLCEFNTSVLKTIVLWYPRVYIPSICFDYFLNCSIVCYLILNSFSAI